MYVINKFSQWLKDKLKGVKHKWSEPIRKKKPILKGHIKKLCEACSLNICKFEKPERKTRVDKK